MMIAPKLKQPLTWLALASFIGLLVPAVFSMGFRWERSLFLVPYVAIIGAFLLVYFRRHPIPLKQLFDHWRLGLIGVAMATSLLMFNIKGYPVSAVPEGMQLVAAILWIGLIYGVIDGLLLNVMPVLVVKNIWSGQVNLSRYERITHGLFALAASIFVTLVYHFGYTEFHGAAILLVIVGNTFITSAYLFTGSPLAAIVTHVIMHIAAVLHGMETTIQLPPHYTF